MLDDKTFNLTGNYESNNLASKFLIASPFIGLNELFNKSLIYIAEHSSNGAIGLIVNNKIHIGKQYDENLIKVFFNNAGKKFTSPKPEIQIFLGGPIEPERGFIIHSNDYDKDFLAKCNDEILISCSPNTLMKILNGSGPKHSLFLMGYTVWRAGQLEQEIADNLWIIAKSDTSLMFDSRNEDKWSNALKQVGIDTSVFCGQVGHG
jgi:putative transcriptional regulator